MQVSQGRLRPALHGFCDDRFQEVRLQFESNFAVRNELGASVCVVHEGRTVVDLFGGWADADGIRPWTADTIVVVFSATKGAVALCAHLLASAGELNLDDPVSRYWPAFARNGRESISVRMLLNHQAGLPGLSQPLASTAVHDFEAMVGLVERETPQWPPGTKHGYHAMTYGWLVGEVVRRVTGQSVGAFFHEQVAEPDDLHFWIGLPASQEHRVATTVMDLSPDTATDARFRVAAARGIQPQANALNSFGGFLDPGGCDAPGAHAAEVPAAGGITNARGLARMYAPLSIGGNDRLPPEQLVQMMATESAAAEDAVMFEPSRFSAGFQKASYGRASLLSEPSTLLLSEAAFGHSGLGGSIGFADPVARFSFGYAMNRHDIAVCGEDARYRWLIDATYRSLGFANCAGGKWL